MTAVATLRAATPVRKTVWLCMDAALQAEWDATLNEYSGADDGVDHSSLAKPKTLELAERLDAIRDRVQATEVGFTFERIGPWGDIALKSAHPPREGNAFDKVRGFNVETYYPALIRAACVSVQKRGDEPESVPDDVWDTLLGTPATDETPAVRGTLNTQQTNRLLVAAQYANDGETTVPPSARSLLESQDSGASLAQPGPGQESPPNGSEAGSPRGSTSTSTTKKARSKAKSGAS